jgi:hypothetical protein
MSGKYVQAGDTPGIHMDTRGIRDLDPEMGGSLALQLG